MKKLVPSSLFLLALMSALPSGAQQRYTGTLDSSLHMGATRRWQALSEASATARLSIPAPVGADDYVATARMNLAENKDAPSYQMVGVFPAQGAPYLYFDKNQDGKFAPDERINFTVDPAQKELDGSNVSSWIVTKTVHLELPVSLGKVRTYPLDLTCVIVPPNVKNHQRPFFQVLRSGFAFATGVIQVQGTAVKVQYPLDPKTLQVDLLNGQLGADSNLDGNIDLDITSFENNVAKGTPVVFRAGPLYFTTVSADIATGRIVAQARTVADYPRVDLQPGKLLPDFSFVDIYGTNHKLSDYRGKYVVLDFWGTWCGPCLLEIARLKKTYPDYNRRGLEVIGMNWEKSGGRPLTPKQYADDLNHVRGYVEKNGVPWVQASQESIFDLVTARLQLRAYPTIIVLDPAGKIVAVNLHGETLEKEIDSLLPHAPHVGGASTASKR